MTALTFTGRWIPVTERLPDDEITVMLHGHAMDEPWCLGYRDAGIWRGLDDYAIGAKITHWADLVPGPQAAPAEPAIPDGSRDANDVFRGAAPADPQRLRDDQILRNETAKKAEDILARIGAL